MSYTLAVGQNGTAATAEVVWSVDGKTYKFRSDNNFISWITTIFEVGDVASGAGTISYRLLNADPSTSINPATGNVAAGSGALGAISTGSNNTALGVSAGINVNSGTDNTLIGRRAGFNGAGAAFFGNVAIGSSAMLNQTNPNQVAVGVSALAGAIGSTAVQNLAIGLRALFAISTGSGNVAIGEQAADAITIANNNTLVGYDAGGAITSGNSNTALGYDALGNAAGAAKAGNTCIGSESGNNITTGNNNTLLGANTDTDITGRADCISIGRNTNTAPLDGTLAIGDAMANLTTAVAPVGATSYLRVWLNNQEYRILIQIP